MSYPKYYRIDNGYSNVKFAMNLTLARESRGLTREQLASAIGRDKQQIWRYEDWKGNLQTPSLETFCKICEVLDIQPNELLNVSEKNNKECPQDGVIYNWEMYLNYKNEFEKKKSVITLRWECNHCSLINILYNFKSNSESYKYIECSVQCEKCFEVYRNLLKVEGNKVYRRIFK